MRSLDCGKDKSFIIAHAREQDGGMNRIRLIVAPHLAVDYPVYDFASELLRLAKQNRLLPSKKSRQEPMSPSTTTEATKAVEEAGGNGKKEEVLRILDRLRAMHHVYNEPSQALGGDCPVVDLGFKPLLVRSSSQPRARGHLCQQQHD
jgi:hypothetical protein